MTRDIAIKVLRVHRLLLAHDAKQMAEKAKMYRAQGDGMALRYEERARKDYEVIQAIKVLLEDCEKTETGR